MVNKVLKSFGTLCVVTYVIVTAISRELTQSISSAVSFSVVLYGIYATILWKYNPFEKTPYIGGTYHAKHWSSYENKHESESTIVIKQTLFSLSLSERSSAGCNTSISTSLSPAEGDQWRFVYTYQTHPFENAQRDQSDQDDPHFGTMIMYYQPDKPDYLEGTYFTDRQKPTKGRSQLRRQKK